jgi:hypothetical protein
MSYKGQGRSVVRDSVQGVPKRPYQKPRLMVYGDIRTMTMGNVSGKKADGKKIGPKVLKTG